MAKARHVYTSSNGDLYKYDPEDGTEIWSVSVTSWTSGDTVAANDDGDVWFAEKEEGNVHKFDSNGNEQTYDGFSVSTGYGITAMCADESGNVYVGTGGGKVFKFNGSGSKEETHYASSGDEITALVWHNGDWHYDTFDAAGASGGGYFYHSDNGDYVDQLGSPGGYENWSEWVGSIVGLGADELGVYVGTTSNNGFEAFDTDGGARFTKSGPSSAIGDLATGDSKTVTLNDAPTADFTYTKNGGTVDFTDQSSDPDGSISSWSWDFGDGNTSTAQNPTHTYSSSGTYTVTLTVTDDAGATDTTTQDVSVTTSISGTAALTDQPSSLSLSGQVITKISGALSITDQGPTTSFSASLSNAGTAALTDKETALSLLGSLPLSTSLALTSKQESLSGAGVIANGGSLGLTDGRTSIFAKEKTDRASPYFFHRASDDNSNLVKRSGRDGLKVWEYATNANYIENETWIADKDGNSYLPLASSPPSVIKLGPNSAKQWEWTAGSTYNGIVALDTKPNGNVVVGLVNSDTSPNSTFLVELNASDGTLASTTELSSDTLHSVTADEHGNVYWSGDGVLKKMDSSYNQVWAWTKSVNGGPYQIELLSDRIYARVLTGSSTREIFRISASDGSQTWRSNYVEGTLGGTLDEIAVGNDGSHIYIQRNPSSGSHYYHRLEDTGSGLTETWAKQWDSTAIDDIGADDANNLFVIGDSSNGTKILRADETGGTVFSNKLGVTFYSFALQPLYPALKATLALTDQGETLALAGSPIASGTAQTASKAESIAATGGPYISASGSVTGGKESYAGVANVLASATGGLTSKKESLSAAAQVLAGGSGALTDGLQTLSALGDILASGHTALTDKGHTLALAGAPVASGAAAVASKGEALALPGNVRAAATAALTNAQETVGSTGTILITGSGSATGKGELISIAGDIYAGGTGTLAFTDKPATLSAEGAAKASGDSTLVDAGQSLSLGGVLLITGDSALTDKKQGFGSTGRAKASGAAGLTDKPTLIVIAGGPLATGGGSLTSKEELLALGGGPVAGGALRATGGREALVSAGNARAAGQTDLTDEAALLSLSGGAHVGGELSAEDQLPTLTLTIYVGRKPGDIELTLSSSIIIDAQLQDTE